MKKLIIFLLPFLLGASNNYLGKEDPEYCIGKQNATISKINGVTFTQVSTGGTIECAGTADGTLNVGAWEGQCAAAEFTPSVSGTITSATVRLHRESGTHTKTIQLCIWTDGSPGTEIDCSDAINMSSIGTTEGNVTFSSGLSAAVSNGTAYKVVLKRSGLEGLTYFWYYRSDGECAGQTGMSWSENMYRNSSGDCSGTWDSQGTNDGLFVLTY